MRAYLAVFLLAAAIVVSSANSVTDIQWQNYVTTFNKIYPSNAAANTARFYYAVNLDRINKHNQRWTSGLETYTLAANQYSDLKFVEFAALFPPTTEILSNGVPFTAPTIAPQTSFRYSDLGFNSPVQRQERTCNNGWAQASATAMQIFSALITGTPSSVALSPQNFVDCAGGSRACINQVSQVAFDYLTQSLQKLYPLSEYPYTIDQRQGTCMVITSLNGKSLTSYSNIPNGNDVLLKSVVNYLAPVVIKFNPGSFEFMHYQGGIFTQPPPTKSAAHYMTVVGYGTDAATSKDFWLLQNSFGLTWGELGFIRIERNTAKPITNSAIFPLV